MHSQRYLSVGNEVNIVNAGEGAPASRNRRVATVATCLGLVLTAGAAYPTGMTATIW
jgi:hypothetical protein